MAMLEFLPDHRTCAIGADESILSAAIRAGIPHTHVCEGRARCSTCRVFIMEGSEHCVVRTAEEQALAKRLALGPQIRLACQTRVTGDIKLRRLVLDDEDVQLIRQVGDCASSPEGASAGEERRMVILFADIRDFSALAESLPPYDVIHLLNRFFYDMSGVIERHGGTVNNFIGDGLMALFDAQPPSNEDASARAVTAGLEMIELVRARLVPYVRMFYEKELRIGIGAHLGDVVLGAVGVGPRRQITAIGDAVNLASRIEATNKSFGTEFLVGGEVHQRVSEQFEMRAYNPITLRGTSEQRSLYEVLGKKVR